MDSLNVFIEMADVLILVLRTFGRLELFFSDQEQDRVCSLEGVRLFTKDKRMQMLWGDYTSIRKSKGGKLQAYFNEC
jgi:hypothetical protein